MEQMEESRLFKLGKGIAHICLKLTTLVCFLIPTISSSSQSKLNFIEVRVNSGLSVYGFTSIKLVREGLILRTYKVKKKRENEVIKFVLFKDLDKKKFVALQDYISQNNILKIEQPIVPDSIIVSNHNPIKLSFIQLEQNYYSNFTYQYCDSRIDTLIKLLNELIPKKDRKMFYINQKC